MRFEPTRRELVPSEPEVNTEFINDHISESGDEGVDERVPDSDATFQQLVRSSLNAAFPRSPALDVTVRSGRPSQIAFVATSVRHFIEFTLLLVYLQLLQFFDHHQANMAGSWAIGAFIFSAMFQSLAIDDTSQFFLQVKGAIPTIGTLMLFLFMFEKSYAEAFYWSVAVYFLVLLVSCPTLTLAETAGRRAMRIAAALALVNMLPDAQTMFEHRYLVSFVVIFVANFVLLLPIPFAMQHWFAAQRYTTLEEVRSYGPDATVYEGNRTALMAGILSFVLATGVALFAVLMAEFRLHLFPQEHWSAALFFFFVQCGFVVNSIAFSWCVLRRKKRDARAAIASYYPTWRALAAWLSYEPELRIPAIFQFQRPWSERPIRVGLICCVLGINSIVTVNLLRPVLAEHVTAQYPTIDTSFLFDRPPTTVEPDAYPEETRWSPQIAYWERFQPNEPYPPELLQPTVPVPNEPGTRPNGPPETITVQMRVAYFFFVTFLAVIVPPAILLFTLTATWGPFFAAYNEHFEQFADDVQPPLLSFSIRATKARCKAIGRNS